MDDGCSDEEFRQARIGFTTWSICQLVPTRKRRDRTCCLVGVRLQVVDRQGVYQLYNQYRPNLTTGLGDSLVSFSSLNEHSLARSGCCTTRNEYILSSAPSMSNGLRLALLCLVSMSMSIIRLRLGLDWKPIIRPDPTSLFRKSVSVVEQLLDSSRCHYCRSRYVGSCRPSLW